MSKQAGAEVVEKMGNHAIFLSNPSAVLALAGKWRTARAPADPTARLAAPARRCRCRPASCRLDGPFRPVRRLETYDPLWLSDHLARRLRFAVAFGDAMTVE